MSATILKCPYCSRDMDNIKTENFEEIAYTALENTGTEAYKDKATEDAMTNLFGIEESYPEYHLHVCFECGHVMDGIQNMINFLIKYFD